MYNHCKSSTVLKEDIVVINRHFYSKDENLDEIAKDLFLRKLYIILDNYVGNKI